MIEIGSIIGLLIMLLIVLSSIIGDELNATQTKLLVVVIIKVSFN